jgi:hypothetical protein
MLISKRGLNADTGRALRTEGERYSERLRRALTASAYGERLRRALTASAYSERLQRALTASAYSERERRARQTRFGTGRNGSGMRLHVASQCCRPWDNHFEFSTPLDRSAMKSTHCSGLRGLLSFTRINSEGRPEELRTTSATHSAADVARNATSISVWRVRKPRRRMRTSLRIIATRGSLRRATGACTTGS